MKRLVLFVIALVFAFSTTVMAAEPAAAPVTKEETVKVEKADQEKAAKKKAAARRGPQRRPQRIKLLQRRKLLPRRKPLPRKQLSPQQLPQQNKSITNLFDMKRGQDNLSPFFAWLWFIFLLSAIFHLICLKK